MFTKVADDIVALHIANGRCYGMENVTADVWQYLEHPISLDDLTSRLVAQYNVEPEVCRAQVTELLQQLEAEALVEKQPG
jgi:hypothetical protein